MVIGATGYNGGTAGSSTGSDSSDFALQQLTYTPAATDGAEPVTLVAQGPSALTNKANFELSSTEPVVLTAGVDPLQGDGAGGQTWGGLVGVTATGWDGAPSTAVVGNGGIGVGGGRIDSQIDFSALDEDGDGVPGDSEALALALPDAGASEVALRIDRLLSDDAGLTGKQEVGFWEALDTEGRSLGAGELSPATASAKLSEASYAFDIELGAPIKKVLLSATRYNGDPTGTIADQHSDYSLAQLSYVPAADPLAGIGDAELAA